MNYIFRSLGDQRKKYLAASFAHSTKVDIAVILIFFTELFDGDLIRGSLCKLFTFFQGEPLLWGLGTVRGPGSGMRDPESRDQSKPSKPCG